MRKDWKRLTDLEKAPYYDEYTRLKKEFYSVMYPDLAQDTLCGRLDLDIENFDPESLNFESMFGNHGEDSGMLMHIPEDIDNMGDYDISNSSTKDVNFDSLMVSPYSHHPEYIVAEPDFL